MMNTEKTFLRKTFSRLAAICLAAFFSVGSQAESITVAVASNMKPAFTDLIADYTATHPGDVIEVTYGSSGKLATQIANGAPFDLFFSADTVYPAALAKAGLTTGRQQVYAVGHLVLWSLTPQLGKLPLKILPGVVINKFAIANPATAPYGKRAQEALQHEGAWDALKDKLVLGDNISQTAQFVDTGAADAGIIALSLVMGPELKGKGTWTRIPEAWHQPLDQGFVVLKPAANKALAKDFAEYVKGKPAQLIMYRYGFDAPRQ